MLIAHEAPLKNRQKAMYNYRRKLHRYTVISNLENEDTETRNYTLDNSSSNTSSSRKITDIFWVISFRYVLAESNVSMKSVLHFIRMTCLSSISLLDILCYPVVQFQMLKCATRAVCKILSGSLHDLAVIANQF